MLRLVADGQVLRSAVLFGSQNLVLYSTLTWLPFRVSAGGTGHVTLTLFAFSVPGLLPSTALAATRIRYATSRGFYAIAALAMLASSAALLLLEPDWLWLAARGPESAPEWSSGARWRCRRCSPPRAQRSRTAPA